MKMLPLHEIAPELSDAGHAEVKNVAPVLLDQLKLAIEDVLDAV